MNLVQSNLKKSFVKEVIYHMTRYRAPSNVLKKEHITENNQINPIIHIVLSVIR